MPHKNLTPETVFKPSSPPGSEPVFAFANSEPLDCEQDQYKQLIKAELVRQRLPPAHLADRMQIPRPKLHKILKQNTPLSDTMRDRIFVELHDHVTGLSGVGRIFSTLAQMGFVYDPRHSTGSVVLFQKVGSEDIVRPYRA